MDELNVDYPLTDEQIAAYGRDGFVKLQNVLTQDVLSEFGAEFTRLVYALNRQKLSLAERNTYGKAFLQVPNLWEHSEKVKTFVLCRRLGKIAAELMGVSGVRMYHDQALYKEPGGGFTPWHVDQFYWPLANDNTVTAWIPLQAVPEEMGPLSFCIGSHKLLQNRGLSISDESEQKIGRTLHDFSKCASPFAFGRGQLSLGLDISSGWAQPQRSDESSDDCYLYGRRDEGCSAKKRQSAERLGSLAAGGAGRRTDRHAVEPCNLLCTRITERARLRQCAPLHLFSDRFSTGSNRCWPQCGAIATKGADLNERCSQITPGRWSSGSA